MLAQWETELSVWVLVRRSCHCCELKGRVQPQPEDAILWPIKQTNSQLTQCCLPSFLYQLSISILSLASALTPTQVRRSQFREVTCLEANPTAVKRKKRKKETKQKKKKLSTRSAPRSNSQNDHTRASASTMEKVETQSQRQ